MQNASHASVEACEARPVTNKSPATPVVNKLAAANEEYSQQPTAPTVANKS